MIPSSVQSAYSNQLRVIELQPTPAGTELQLPLMRSYHP